MTKVRLRKFTLAILRRGFSIEVAVLVGPRKKEGERSAEKIAKKVTFKKCTKNAIFFYHFFVVVVVHNPIY